MDDDQSMINIFEYIRETENKLSYVYRDLLSHCLVNLGSSCTDDIKSSFFY